jgi:hypothetical protein
MADKALHPLTPKGVGKRAHKPRWYKAFIAALRDTGNVRESCEAAGITRTAAYDAAKRDEEFAAAWEDAIQDAADMLESAARKRAHDGLRRYKFTRSGEPIMHPDDPTKPYYEIEYSDALVQFLLRGIRPEKYRDAKATAPDPDAGGKKSMTDAELAVETARLLAVLRERQEAAAEGALSPTVGDESEGTAE